MTCSSHSHLTCFTSWRIVFERENVFAFIFLIATVRPSLKKQNYKHCITKLQIHRRRIKLVKSDSKDIYTRDSVSNKCCSFDLSIHL